MATKTLEVVFTGIRPLVTHNGQMIDPTNAFVRSIKAITKKKAKTDDDHEQVARLEWEAGLYFDPKEGPIMPSENIERCIQAGAQKSKLGKQFQAAVFVEDEFARIEYDGPRDPEALYADPGKRFQLRRPVKVQTARVMRVRPMFPTGWKIAFQLTFDPAIIDRSDLVKAMEDAGSLCGLGDWRPKFGRFLVSVK